MTRMSLQEDFKLPEVITLNLIKKLITHLKRLKRLKQNMMNEILDKSSNIFKELPNVIEINPRENAVVTVVGDTHGQFFDVVNIFERYGFPTSSHLYLFNGDYVDRGSFGTENIFLLFLMKLAFPMYIHILRGNHESERCTSTYGFKNEVTDKYGAAAYSLFLSAFNTLPLAAIVNDEIFVTHGGLFDTYGVTIDMINKTDRFCDPGMEGGDHLMEQLLWSDPSEYSFIFPSIRSFGCLFGRDVTKEFCKTNGLKVIVRSHECRKNGFTIQHEGTLITLFSAPSYCCDTNLGAILNISYSEGSSHLRFKQFKSVPFPRCKCYMTGEC
ncbi:putative protein phosphatase D3 [Monocercomonoides exilis]|uniref:putative protein phosphatase D3 n=1 Tax=Monocercomonoides exilis TaxID=2049356 RepID=UPI003559E3C8|nr:putative protein phosphatase D3 [Monocercomonoides exilis]|eukprot:MONOS_2387.1-p1 / transcript=MONOS_2387.1 / gene=MONOS_2387 / organism=Monocercomonoides_exilis_PA203 / gene_product=protein phosphatase D3, isoform A / transcript_product=protein phosphatase D3, isoform A / location=Mono_scaffold00049:46081-47833(-) / protein_length=326 / sequence_SO=supercontig / SO=protein_coding / is_pseudo=false